MRYLWLLVFSRADQIYIWMITTSSTASTTTMCITLATFIATTTATAAVLATVTALLSQQLSLHLLLSRLNCSIYHHYYCCHHYPTVTMMMLSWHIPCSNCLGNRYMVIAICYYVCYIMCTLQVNSLTDCGYIKEFVHGDFGRTQPNLSTLLKADCDIITLDVNVILH